MSRTTERARRLHAERERRRRRGDKYKLWWRGYYRRRHREINAARAIRRRPMLTYEEWAKRWQRSELHPEWRSRDRFEWSLRFQMLLATERMYDGGDYFEYPYSWRTFNGEANAQDMAGLIAGRPAYFVTKRFWRRPRPWQGAPWEPSEDIALEPWVEYTKVEDMSDIRRAIRDLKRGVYADRVKKRFR